MKKIINGFAIVFFLAPIFASAMAVHYSSCGDFNLAVGSPTPVCSGSGSWNIGGGSTFLDDTSAGGFNPLTPGGVTYYFSCTAVGTGLASVRATGDGSGTFVNVSAGLCTDIPFVTDLTATYQGLQVYGSGGGGFSGDISDICVSDAPGECTSPPPPPPAPPDTSIDHAIGVATSSFQNTYGFDMDGLAAWMWDNLGQPIAGSGIGTLLVMRWQLLGLIAISLIIFFAFSYFRFFRH